MIRTRKTTQQIFLETSCAIQTRKPWIRTEQVETWEALQEQENNEEENTKDLKEPKEVTSRSDGFFAQENAPIASEIEQIEVQHCTGR